ncbi:MAG: hypothetical protein ACI4PH_05090 [Faecousia sp.]
METEAFISGYCRQLDASRMVELLLEDGRLSEADCCYGNCLYQSNCPIAKEIDQYQ